MSSQMETPSCHCLSQCLRLLLVVTTFGCLVHSTHGARQRKRKLTAEEQLMMELFRGYDTDARGVIHTNTSVTVSIDFLLLRLQTLNERSQVLMTTGLVITEWSDERLTWDPKLYNGIKDVVVRANRIWTPELAIINGADDMIQEFEKIRVLISHTGKVHWEPGGVFSTTCDIDITYFPFDRQHCPIEIGAWSYTSNRMNLTNTINHIEMTEFKQNGEWDIKGTRAEWEGVELPCCAGMVYSKVKFIVQMNRRYMFYIMNIILPCLLLSVLILIVFCVPPDAGEKISSGISVLLAFTVFLLMLADNVPRTSLDVPILVVYLGTIMTLGTASVCLSVIVLHFHHRGRHGPVPRWARAFFLGTCARFLGVPGSFASPARHARGSLPHPVEDCDACEMLEVHHRILDSKGRPLPTDDIEFHHRQDNHVNFQYNDIQQQQQPHQNQHRQQQTAASVYSERRQQHQSRHHHLEDSPPCTPRVTEDEVTVQRTLEENIKEWQLLARVLDRIFFTVVFFIMLLSAVFILLSPWYIRW